MSLADAMYYSQLQSQNGGVVTPEQIAARTYNQNSHLFGATPQQSVQTSGQNPLDVANYVDQQPAGFVNPAIYNMDVRGNQMQRPGQNSPAFANARPGSGATSVTPWQAQPPSFGPQRSNVNPQQNGSLSPISGASGIAQWMQQYGAGNFNNSYTGPNLGRTANDRMFGLNKPNPNINAALYGGGTPNTSNDVGFSVGQNQLNQFQRPNTAGAGGNQYAGPSSGNNSFSNANLIFQLLSQFGLNRGY